MSDELLNLEGLDIITSEKIFQSLTSNILSPSSQKKTFPTITNNNSLLKILDFFLCQYDSEETNNKKDIFQKEVIYNAISEIILIFFGQNNNKSNFLKQLEKYFVIDEFFKCFLEQFCKDENKEGKSFQNLKKKYRQLSKVSLYISYLIF